MHAWKSFLLSSFCLGAWLVSGFSLWQILTGNVLWIGVLLTWLPLQLVNLWRGRWQTNLIEDEREITAMAACLIGLGVLLIAGDRSWPLAMGGLGLAGLLLYRFWLTSVKPGLRETQADTAVLQQGALLQQAEDGLGQTINLAEVCSQPTLLVFMRGDWCPFSALVAHDVKAMQTELADVRTLLVYGHELDSGAMNSASAHSSVRYVSDPEQALARSVGISLRGGAPWWARWRGKGRDSICPALALLNREGECVYWEQASNYRLPPTPRNCWSKLKARLN